MSFDRKEFVNEIVKDICKEYAFEGSVRNVNNGIRIDLVSHYTHLSYTQVVLLKAVEPTADCFIKIRRDIVLGLNKCILNYFKIKV